MDLAELKFVVDTKQLEDAAKKIEALGVAVSKVNKPVTDAALKSEKLAAAQAKTAEATTKAETAQLKLSQAQEKVNNGSKTSVSVLERQTMILDYMAQGYSKGQSSILATAKAAGALDDAMIELGGTLKTQRTLIGGDTFDKSIGLMQKLQNETRITSEVNNLFNKNLGLTEKQMIDLAREKERLIALYNLEGKSLTNLTTEYDKIVAKSVELNRANDARTKNIRDQVKAQNDAAKATAYVADADARLAAALDVTNAKLDKQASDALVKYEKNLRLMGLGAGETAAKLAKAKTQFDAIADKKQADKLQYLARAISVQMGDVGISLASGMNPLLVMIQQGDQIRGAIQQAGASGKELQSAMSNAATQIATSFIDTGKAIGGFFVNAIKSAGQAIIGLPLELANASIKILTGNTDLATAAFERLKISAITFGKLGIVTIIAGLAVLGNEYLKVTNAEKNLTKELSISGAALGLSTDGAIEYSNAMNNIGISSMDAMRLIAEFAATSTDASIPLEQIVKSAKDMEKYVGIASKDTMKAFADVSEKPVEGLIKLAKSTGNVSVETIKMAKAVVDAGDNAKAAAIAQEALRSSNDEVVKRMKNNLDPLQKLWLDIKSVIGQAGQALYDFLKSSTVVAVFRTAWETVAVIVAEVWYVLKQTGTEISGIASQIKAVMSGDFSKAADIGNKMKAEAKTAREEQDKLVASILNRTNAQKESLNTTEAERIANRKVAKEYEELLKKKEDKPKKGVSDLEKEKNEFLKVMSDLEDRSSGFTKHYSDQLNILNIGLVEGWLSQDEFNMKLQELNSIQPGVIKAYKDQEEALKKVIEAQKKADDALFDSLDTEHALNTAIIDQTDALNLQRSLIGATDAERKKALATKRLDLQLEKEIADINKRAIPQTEKDQQILRATQRRLDAEKNINTEIANDFIEKQLAEYNRISDGLTDAVITGLTEGGKAGRKKLRDLIVAELKKPITIVVKALVDATLGSFIQSAIGGSDSSGGIGSTASTANNLFSLYKNGSSAFNVGAQYAAGTMSAANAGGTLFANATGTGIDGLLATNGAYGTAAEGSMAASAAEFASYIPQIAAVLAIANIAGLFKSTETVGGGLTGTLGKGNIQSYQLTRESGTLLSGPDYAMADVKDSAVSAAIQNAFTVVKKANIEMASQLGLATDNIVNFTTQLGTDYVHPDIQQYGLVFDNLTPEQANTKIKEALASAGEEMAQTILGTFTQITDENKTLVTETKKGSNIGWLAGEYVRVGEKASEALARLSNSLISVNSAFKQVGFTLYDIGLAGADAASTLIDLFGGLSNFNQSIGFFYENFFTDSEKLANLSKDLTVEFDKLNLTLPSTREEFKQLVISAQKAGDTALVKNLTDLQYAFADLVPATESITESVDNLTESALKYARSLIEEQRITLGAGAYTASDFYTGFATSGYSNTELYNPVLASPIMSNAINSMNNNDNLVEAINSVQNEILELRYEVQADATHNAKTATILTRVVPDGQSLNVTATIDGGVV